MHCGPKTASAIDCSCIVLLSECDFTVGTVVVWGQRCRESSMPLKGLDTALTQIEKHAGVNVERGLEIQRRVHRFRKQIARGSSTAEPVRAEEASRLVELINSNKATLEDVGSELRASLALALPIESAIAAIVNPS